MMGLEATKKHCWVESIVFYGAHSSCQKLKIFHALGIAEDNKKHWLLGIKSWSPSLFLKLLSQAVLM